MQCWKLQKKNKAKAASSKDKEKKRTFSNKGLHKEINLLAKEKANNKCKVLKMYAEVIKKEKAKRKAKKPKEDTNSESEMSVEVVE
jgi:hypothetical protein